MVARTFSIALLGLTGSIVEIEADLSGGGLPSFALIGLPDASLSEAYHRVKSACANTDCPFPPHKLTVNLSPAALPKHGPGFDLAIALATMALSGLVPAESLERVVHLGELGLDGRLRPIRGVLPAVIAARDAGFRTVMVGLVNAAEARLVPDVDVVAVGSLRSAAIWHGADLDPTTDDETEPAPAADEEESTEDLADVIGNDSAVDALQIAAAGGHHLLMLGPPGAGKTMLANRLRGLLPDLDPPAALEVSCLRSLAGDPVGDHLALRPPLEAPHHTATAVSMVGGGSGQVRPGAAARASRGILFLDEAPEFAASALDALRQPLESGRITIHRANYVAQFPGHFQLVLAANPCPCGQYGAPDSICTCAPYTRRRYLARMSGPLLDRIDLQLQVARITVAELREHEQRPRVTTATARTRVAGARARAADRLAGTPWRINSDLPGTWLRGPGALGRTATVSLDRALERGGITMRGYDRVLRVAWTICDLADTARPDADDVGRALYLRRGISA